MGKFNRDDRSGGDRSFGRRDSGRPSFGGGRSSFGGGRPEMHHATCNECGKDCEVPFRPTGNRPIFCSNCFEKQGGGSGSSRPRERSFGGGRPSFGGDRGDREMHDAICEKCGENCQVPFRPTPGKPIFCDNCFEKGGKGKGNNDQLKEQIEILNAKLDKIIKALNITSSKTVSEEKKEEKIEKTEEKETKKTKSADKKTVAKKTTKKKK